MNPIHPFCYYCSNGTPLQVGREVSCPFNKENLMEWDDTCDNWKLGSLLHIKKAAVGVVPCLKCEHFEFYAQISKGICRIAAWRKDLTILSTCSNSMDQGYNFAMTGDQFARALDAAVDPAETRIAKENVGYENWALSPETDDEIIARCIAALPPIANKGNPVFLNAYRAEFYQITGMDSYIKLNRRQISLIREIKEAMRFKFPKLEKTAHQKALSIQTLQLQAFARLVLPHI